MRKVLRVAGVLVLMAVGLGLVGVSVSLCPVDRASFKDSDFAAATRLRVDALSKDRGVRLRWGDLRAGFGRASLNPTLGNADDDPRTGAFRFLPLAGYGDRRGAPATGIHDELWAKAIAFQVAGMTGVVLSADLLIVPREVAQVVAEDLATTCGLPRGHLYLGATHTHCSLGGWGEGWVGEAFAGGFQPPVRAWMAQQLAAAARAALADLSPAAMAHGSFQAAEYTRNRLVGAQGRADSEFSLVLVRQDDGDRAILGTYSAHATVLPGAFREFSGDYPGYWQRGVETDARTLAVFLAGGVGSHGPKAPTGGLAGAQAMGEALAQQTRALCETLVVTNRAWLGLATVDAVLPPLQVRVSQAIRLRPWLARRLLPVGTVAPLQAWRIGNSLWLSTPCDYSGELALDLKATFETADLQLAVTSFNGDYVGYVVPEEYYALNTYETRTMSFFGPQLPGFFDASLRSLSRLVVGDQEAGLTPANAERAPW